MTPFAGRAGVALRPSARQTSLGRSVALAGPDVLSTPTLILGRTMSRNIHGGWGVQLVTCACALAWVAPASGQQGVSPDTAENRDRQIAERIRRTLDREPPTARKATVDWGGWLTAQFLSFDDGVKSSRTQRRTQLRLWTSLADDKGIHTGYARMRLGFVDWNSGDSYTGRDDDWQGPNLERDWYRLDAAKALGEYGGVKLPSDLTIGLTIGREFVTFGTGLALALPLDAVLVRAGNRRVSVTGLIGRTISSYSNIDRSPAVEDGMERTFFGAEVRYLGLDRHEPFAYFFYQNDMTGERLFDPLQEYDYDTRYFGIGSRGEIAAGLQYQCEVVYERGTSYGDRQFLHRDRVSAVAADAELAYTLGQSEALPKFAAEYLFASGDADRLGSPTDAVGGNRNNRDDHGFVGFGFRDTGLSFAGTPTNLHMGRVGFSLYPLRQTKRFRRLLVGTDWFLLYKNRSSAAASDPTADKPSAYLGWEMDYFADWRVASDLSVTARLGLFFPGDAYSDRTTRTFFFTGLVWSF